MTTELDDEEEMTMGGGCEGDHEGGGGERRMQQKLSRTRLDDDVDDAMSFSAQEGVEIT